MDNKEIKKLALRHVAVSVLASIVLSGVISAVSYSCFDAVTRAAVFSALFYGLGFAIGESAGMMHFWNYFATKQPESLPTFYTASTGMRLLGALAILFIIYLRVGRDAMLPYFLVFMAFYFLLLTLHSSFFKKMTKKMM